MKKLLFIISFFVLILNCTAQITFQKTFGAPPAIYDGHDVRQTTDGGYIVSGNNYLAKTDAYGDTLWTKIGIGGQFVRQTTDGGYITSEGADLVKTDANGNVIWAKNYGGTAYTYYVPYCVQQTTDGGYIVTGFVQSSFTSNTADVYLFKTDSGGNLIWAKTFGGANGDEGHSVQQTTDGGYIIAGTTASFGAGAQDVYLLKTDTIGNLAWSKTFGGIGPDLCFSVQQTTDGGYIIAGSTYLIKTDANGDSLWVVLGQEASCVQQTIDGGYIMVGSAWAPPNNSSIVLTKVDTNGDQLWAQSFAGSQFETGSAVRQTSDGGYIIIGTDVAGLDKTHLIKTDSLGRSCTAPLVGGFGPAYPPVPLVTSPATIVTSISLSVTNPAVTDSSGVFVTTVCLSIGINEITENNTFLISPNPSPGNFIISFQRTMMKGNIEILNLLGEKVFTENIFNESKKEIDLKDISDGIYFLKVLDGEKSYSRKLIVEQE